MRGIEFIEIGDEKFKYPHTMSRLTTTQPPHIGEWKYIYNVIVKTFLPALPYKKAHMRDNWLKKNEIIPINLPT